MYNNVDITDMQCWIFRLAQKKWGLTPDECSKIFQSYDIMGFISECYETLHQESYDAVLADVESIVRSDRYGDR